MSRITIPFAGGSQQDRSVNISGQRAINLYPVVKKPGGKGQVALYSTPGAVRRLVAGVGPIRSHFVTFGDYTYVVSGSELYQISSLLVATLIGTLSTSSSRVSMVAGRNYLALVDGTYGYSYDGTTFAQIADADFPASPSHISYLDGYFLTNHGDTDDFYISAVEDPTSWAALDYATANAAPDDIVAHATTSKDFYAIGAQTTQVYFNSGNPDFPFDPYPGAIPVGIDAPHSLAEGTPGLFWLAASKEGDKVVVNVQAGGYTVISDDELNWQINDLASTSDALGWLQRHAGQTFYWLTFPAANRTWVYHVEQGFWHERQGYQIDRHFANGYGYFADKHFIGDYRDGRVYELDWGTYTDDGDPISRKRIAQILHKDGLSLIVHDLILDAQSGVGQVGSGQDSDPQVMLRYSVDGGHRYSDELWAPLGKVGEYDRVTAWSQLGQGRSFTFEWTVTDPVDVTMINAYADIEVCSN